MGYYVLGFRSGRLQGTVVWQRSLPSHERRQGPVSVWIFWGYVWPWLPNSSPLHKRANKCPCTNRLHTENMVPPSPDKCSLDSSPDKCSLDSSSDKCSLDSSPDKCSLDSSSNQCSLDAAPSNNLDANDDHANDDYNRPHRPCPTPV